MTSNARAWSSTMAVLVALLGLLIGWLMIGCLGPIKSVLLSVWGAGFGGLVWYIGRRVERVYETHWYDTAKHVKAWQEKWPEIDVLIDAEPLKHESSFRVPKMKLLRDLVAWLFLALFLAYTFKVIFSVNFSGKSSIGIADWALPVGVLALIGTGLSVFYQVRLTARTQNRKEWIKALRGKMTALISLSDHRNESEKRRLRKVRKKITELELLLNPGEPLHRTFLTLVRTVHGIDDGFDKKVKSCLPDTFAPKKMDGKDSESVSLDVWKARTVRLSNVILKYEWERVKHAE